MEVAVRVRPLLSRENGLASKWTCQDNSICSASGGKANNYKYAFDHVFGPEVENSTVYKKIAEKIVLQSMQGYHGTVFTYGQSGSGKTYTMDALTKMALDTMYDHINKTKEREFILRLSYIELYNEHLLDLLTKKEGSNLVIREDVDRNVYIEGLIEEVICYKEDAYSLINIGNEKRRFAETKKNDFSSRAHCILRIVSKKALIEHNVDQKTIESKEQDDYECSSVLLSHLNLVDLAGSERPAENSNDRLKEGCHINKSLLALSLVVSKLSEEQSNVHINYRDSKLTRILQNALGGNSRTAILCTISPTSMEETQSTLRFADNARYVKNKPKVNKIMSVNAQLEEALLQILRLKEKIKKLEQGCQSNDENNPSVYPMPLPEPVFECTAFAPKNVDRRKSMFGDVAKARRRSFFVTTRSKPMKEISLNQSGWGDSNLLLAKSLEDQDEGFQLFGPSMHVTERCKDSSEGQNIQDITCLKKEQDEDEVAEKQSGQNLLGIDCIMEVDEMETDSSSQKNTNCSQGLETSGILIDAENASQMSHDTLKEELCRLRLLLEEKEQECKGSQDELQTMASTVVKLEDKIVTMVEQVDEKDAELEEFCDKIENLEALIERGKEMLKNKNKEIESLTDKEKLKDEPTSLWELDKFKNELSVKDKNLAEANNRLQMMDEKIKMLEEQNNDKEAKLQGANIKVETLTLDGNSKQHNYNGMEEELIQLRQELGEKDHALTGNQDAIQMMEEELRKLKNLHSEKEAKLQEMCSKVDTLTLDGNNKQHNYNGMEQELIQLRQELGEKDHALTGNQDAFQMMEEELRKLKNLHSEKEAKLQEMCSKVETLTFDGNNKQDNYKGMEEEMIQLRKEVGDKDNALAGNQNTIQMMEEELRKLKNLHSEKEAKLQEMCSKVETLTFDGNNKQDNYKGMEEEMIQLRKEVGDKDNALAGNQNTIQMMEEELRKLKNLHSEKEAKLQEMCSKVETLTLDGNNKQHNYNGMEQELIQLRQELGEKDHALTGNQDAFQMMEEELRKLKNLHSEKEAKLQEMCSKVETLTFDGNNKQDNYKGMEEEMIQLRKEVGDKDHALAGNQNTIQMMEEELRNLKNLHSEKEAKLQEMCNKVDTLTLDGNSKQHNYNGMEEELIQLRQELGEKDHALAGNQDAFQMMEEELRKLRNLHSEKEAKLQEMCSKVETLTFDGNNKQDNYKGMEEEMIQLRKEVGDKDHALAGNQNTIQMMEEELRKLKNLHSEKEAKLQEMCSKVETLTFDGNNKQDNYKGMEEEMIQLRKELGDKDHTLAGNQNTIQMMEEELRKLKNLHSEKEAKLQEMCSKVETLTFDGNNKQDNYKGMEEEMIQLRKELGDKDHTLAGNQNTIQMMEEELRKLKNLHSEKEAKLQEMCSKVENISNVGNIGREHYVCSEEFENLKSELSKKEKELNLNNSRIQSLRNFIRNMQEVLRDKQTQIKTLTSTVDDLEGKCQAMEVDKMNITREKEKFQKECQIVGKSREEDMEYYERVIEQYKLNLRKQQDLGSSYCEPPEPDTKPLKTLTLDGNNKQDNYNGMEQELIQLKRELGDKDHALAGNQNTIQMMEEELRKLKNLHSENEAKLQEMCSKVETLTLDGNSKQHNYNGMEQELIQLRQELGEKDHALAGNQNTIQMMEEELRKLKNLHSENEAKLQEMCSKVENISNVGNIGREHYVCSEELENLKSELSEKEIELNRNNSRIQSLQNIIRNGQEALSVKHSQIKTLTSTVGDLEGKCKAMEVDKMSIAREKQRFQKECQILGKNREEDKEYYEMVIEQYKLNLRKQQDLGSSYLEPPEPDTDRKPLKSQTHNVSHHQDLSKEHDKENLSEDTKIKKLESKLQHYETIIKDLRAQIPDQKKESDARAEGYSRQRGGVVDYVVMLNKDHYIKKLERQLKQAQAQIESQTPSV